MCLLSLFSGYRIFNSIIVFLQAKCAVVNKSTFFALRAAFLLCHKATKSYHENIFDDC